MGRPRARRRPLVAARLARSDLDVEATATDADLLHRRGDDREVAIEDPVAGEGARHLDDERRPVGDDRDDVLERREPHRFGQLRAQELGDGGPHVLFVDQRAPPGAVVVDNAFALRSDCVPFTVRRRYTTSVKARPHRCPQLWTTVRRVRRTTVARLPRRLTMSLVGPTSVRGCQADRVTPSLARSGCAAVRSPGRAWSASLTSPPGHRDQAVEEVVVEAYVPAQQPPSCPQARLSRPDEHPRRACRAQEPARQGPRSPVGLTNRIRERDAFERLRRDGTRIHSTSLWCNFLVRSTDGAVEHGVRDRTRLRFRRRPQPTAPPAAGTVGRPPADGAAAPGPAADRRPAHRCRTDVRSTSHGVGPDARSTPRIQVSPCMSPCT